MNTADTTTPTDEAPTSTKKTNKKSRYYRTARVLGPVARSRESHLWEISRLSQRQVAVICQVTPQAIQAAERAAIAKIRAALLRDPELLAEICPERASQVEPDLGAPERAHLREYLTIGDHFIPVPMRHEIHGWERKSAQLRQLGMVEEADEILREVKDLKRRIAGIRAEERTIFLDDMPPADPAESTPEDDLESVPEPTDAELAELEATLP